MTPQPRVKVRSLRRWLGWPAVFALAVFGAACNKGNGAPPPPLFNTPGDVDMVCYDRQYDPKGASPDAPVVLPRHCCNSSFVYYPDAEGDADAGADDPRMDEACTGSRVDPTPHALLTQTLRGEVAAVDLIEDEVIDGLRSIPGYTFVDVGGEPTAVVVPPTFPCPADGEQEFCGAPVFTYVAGREQDEVRAVSTCGFRMGRRCGPDLQEKEMEVPSEDGGTEKVMVSVPSAAQKAVPLVGAPADMVLDPNGRALWVSLPERGLLARVALSTGSEDEGEFDYPFELDENGVPKAPEYFPLPSGIDLTPPEPVLESDPYLFTCGLGYTFDPALDRLTLPNAPRMASQKKAHPTRMTFADVGDGTQTLLVVDDAQAVVHALSVSEAGPSVRAVMPVGAPLRDFAVTPAVPAKAPTAADLVSKTFYYTPDTDPDVVDPVKEDSKRYFYGIDARDGSVMAFDLTLNAGVPALTPLLAPAPARDVVRRFSNFGDRIGVGGDGAFTARTLAVIDTRQQLLPTGVRDDFFCGEYDDKELEKNKNEAAKNSADEAYWLHQKEVLDTASDDQAHQALRGVFLMITGSSGVVAVIDIHNLDLQCRARTNCREDDPDKLDSASAARGVALQRHAVRLGGIEAASASISASEDLEADGFRFGVPPEDGGAGEAPDAGDNPEPGLDGGAPPEGDAGGSAEDGGDEPGTDDAGEDAGSDADGDGEDDEFPRNKDGCPIGYYRVPDSSALVCAAANPWRARPATWSATYRGGLSIGVQFSAALEQGDGGEVLMQAPEGLDFCERGVESGDVERNSFAVVIVSSPEDDTPEFCDRDDDAPWRLLVRQAYQDHLVLEMDPDVKLPSGEPATLDDIRTCFSDFSEFQVRLADSWRVQQGDSIYTHRVMTGPDGACVVDREIDRRWVARTYPTAPYVDPYIAFQLAWPDDINDPDSKETINPVITLDLEAAPLTMQFTTGPRFDTLPVRMRYFPEAGYLFVVDGASQGLTSISSFPVFEVDETYH